MVLIQVFLIAAIAVANSSACLPGLGGGGGGGACCPPAQPACGNPCGGGAPPAPVYASAPLAPAPFAGYPTGPQGFQGSQGGVAPSYGGVGGGVAPNFPSQAVYNGPDQSVHAGGSYADAFGRVQGGQPSQPQVQVQQQLQQQNQVQPLPLLGQPVAYEQGPQLQRLTTTQVLTKVVPGGASAVLDENNVQANNIVSSIIAQTQNGYGDEQQHAAVVPGAASSSSSSSSSSASAEHHQVRVPSASSSVEVSERVHPEHVAVQVQPSHQPQHYQPRPHVAVHQQIQEPVPDVAQAPIQVSEPAQVSVQVQPVQPIQQIQPAAQPVQQAQAPARATHSQIQQVPVHHELPQSIAEIKPAPTHTFTQESDRIEVSAGNDYDQPAPVAAETPAIPNNEQETVNQLLASLDQTTVPSNLDFHQVTVEASHHNQVATSPQHHTQQHTQQQQHHEHQAEIISTQAGDDYDAAPGQDSEEPSQSLNEDRKDVPSHGEAPKVEEEHHVEVENVPEETAPIIPQPAPIQPYHPAAPVPVPTPSPVQSREPEVHLQPVQPAVRVEPTPAPPVQPTVPATPDNSYVPEVSAVAPAVASVSVNPASQVPVAQVQVVQEVVTPSPSGYSSGNSDSYATSAAPAPAAAVAKSFEYPVEVHEIVTPAVAVEPTDHNDDIENITSQEEVVESTQAPPPPTDTHTAPESTENEVETVPNLNEYGSKFAKVQGAGTKQVDEPIELNSPENPYRKFWIF